MHGNDTWLFLIFTGVGFTDGKKSDVNNFGQKVQA